MSRSRKFSVEKERFGGTGKCACFFGETEVQPVATAKPYDVIMWNSMGDITNQKSACNRYDTYLMVQGDKNNYCSDHLCALVLGYGMKVKSVL